MIYRFRVFCMMCILAMVFSARVCAQDADNNTPVINYSQPQRLVIGGIDFEGAEGYEDYLLIGVSGLSVGQSVNVPGDEVTQAIKRFWKHGLFSDVKILADSIVDDKIYLKFVLSMRPRVSGVNVNGVKKSEQEDIEKKCGIVKGNQITPNIVNRAKTIIKRYYDGWCVSV